MTNIQGYQQQPIQRMSLSHKMINELMVLQMPQPELVSYIDEALVDNPILETDADDEHVDADTVEPMVSEWLDVLQDIEGEYVDHHETDQSAHVYSEFGMMDSTPSASSLSHFLMAQLGEISLDNEHYKSCLFVIHSLDDSGYLRESEGEIACLLKIPTRIVSESIEVVQKMDPAGVGSRCLKECILLQLDRVGLSNPTIKRIVDEYLEWLGKGKYKAISYETGIPVDQVVHAHETIRHLYPKPGMLYSDTRPNFIVPEILVRDVNGELEIEWIHENTPTLFVSSQYRNMLKNKANEPDVTLFIRRQIAKAMNVINTVERRKKTILRIAMTIVQHQESFIRKGPSFLNALTMKSVADETGLHESTISRTVNQKYIMTPQGTFELKHFFSVGVVNNIGDSISTRWVKALVYKIILAEDKEHPFSDEQIRRELEKEKVQMARRTVAKYREDLMIRTAAMRKVL